MAAQAPGNGDSAIGQNAVNNPAANDAAITLAKLSAEANTGKLGGDNFAGGALRIAGTTVDGVAHIPLGMIHGAEEYYHHPMELVKTVAESAAIGAAVKMILPEAGPVAKVAACIMGGMFVAQAAPGIYEGYKEGYNAKSWSDLNTASGHLGDTVGTLADNMAIGVVGYKIGTGLAGNLLASESMDGFAKAKADFYGSMGESEKAALLKPKVVDGRAEFQGSARLAPTDAKGAPLESKPIDPDSPMSVQLKVDRLNQGTFDRLVERIKAGKSEPITREEYNAKFGAKPESITQVQQFAKAHGLEVGKVNTGARSVELKGTVAQMGKAFNVELKNFVKPGEDGETFRGRVGKYSVPEELGSRVQSVLGLDQRDIVAPKYIMAVEPGQIEGQTLTYHEPANTFPMKSPNTIAETTDEMVAAAKAAASKAQLVADTADAAGKPKPNAPAKPKALQKPLPADTIMKAYGADPDTFTGKGNHAFISFGGTVDAEAEAYAKGKGYAGKFNTIQLGSEAPTADPTGANVENDLDYVTQALNLKKGNINMLSNDNSTQGFVKGVDYVNHPSTNVEYKGASTSWGGPDKQAWNAQGRAALDESLKDGIALGKTLSFSAGDDGVTDRGSLPAQTDYPASSGNGIAVGGTQLVLNLKDGNRTSEVVWGHSGATGGGVSAVESKPVYQKFITWLKSLSGKDGRILPDISLDGSPLTPVEVPTSQGLAGVGGTSFSNPLFYAGTRLLSEASGKDIGFINTQLYQWGQDPVIAQKVFFDVTQGDNGMGKPGYHAGPGFDAASGWGAPNFDAMVAELKNPTHPLLSGARSLGYGIGTSALRGAHTAITNPKALIPSFSSFKGWNTQNETKPGA